MTFLRRFLILLLGLALLATPTIVRDWGLRYNERAYTPPDVPELNLAATPVPTTTAQAVRDAQLANDDALRRGPVVVDFAHFSFLNPANLQPLADALADRGLGLRYWVSKVDTMALESSAQFPDQSEDLATQLKEASALVVVSPFFMWTPQEIAVTERFVADGGRLLLASDPDINGDFPSLVNILAEPFGVVFNDDYLYDTAHNDGNYTFFFNEDAPIEGEAAGAERLADAQIAFYGGRSIGGAVLPQLRSAATTLSSLRTGQSGFTTVGIGGVTSRGTAGRVLALSDFDVLSEVYRVRHDNQRMVEFVADFLSAAQRNNTMADFPEYLGKAVALSYGAGLAIDANLLLQGAQLQQRLENTGRTLTLTNGHALNKPSPDGTDLIYLTDYTTALSETTLLSDLGIQVITEAVTVTIPVEVTPVAPTKEAQKPTKTAEATPTATPTPAQDATKDTPEDDEEATPAASDNAAKESFFATSTVTATGAITTTDTVTPTVLPEITPTVEPKLTPTLLPKVTPTVLATTTRALGTTDTATATTEPLTVTASISDVTVLTATVEPKTHVEITTYLETAEGLRFLAAQTVLVAQRKRDDGSLLLAVLGADRRGIDAGVTRLLTTDFKDCVIGAALTFCSLPPQATPTRSSSSSSSSTDTKGSNASSDSAKGGSSDNGRGGGSGGSEPTKTPTASTGVLLIDDNRSAAEGESSEADLYLQTLIGTGHSVDLWSAESQGSPTADDLAKYTWVIWSNAGYADGKLSIDDMDLVFGYVRQGGRLTLSSRFPLPGIEDASTLRDVVIGDMADLAKGLPDEPITLSEEQNAANLSPLAADTSGVTIALRRGPASDDAEAPVLVVLTDATESDSNARFMIVGMSLTGLAAETSATLINNMATWMMAE